eukprot:CAMPEP_0195055654 /NCGR_PEP_ID=MMETSP0448-20130528/4275_1 /TAXON_ID=66468 /ORGANISM="Heterocapsa triquestra, Strain CCMP 448" /LENGTH=559 /DNA_ID=CAMNT_0040085339 /DNA_START=36 /DNA_END=1715 /DNA_ORIENTATION=-
MTMSAATAAAPGRRKAQCTGPQKEKAMSQQKPAAAVVETPSAPKATRSPLGQDLVAAAAIVSPKSPAAVARTADARRLPVGASSPSGCMVVEVDESIARIVPMLGGGCGVCQTECGPSTGGRHTVIEGRPVCETCKVLFDPSGFVPEHRVCINPLCRRKWKQRSPKVLPIFCPPCKRQLEEGVPGGPNVPEATLLQQICRHWRTIWKELGEAIPEVLETGPPLSAAEGPPQVGDDPDAWRNDVMSFKQSFPPPACTEDVRNWNSVHGRRRHYRGIVRRGVGDFVCHFDVLEELEGDLVTARKVAGGGQAYPVIDWRGLLTEGQEVHFAVFPNPAVSERGAVAKIVQLLSGPEAEPGPGKEEARSPPLAACMVQAAAACDLNTQPISSPEAELDSSPNDDAILPHSMASFDDLMQWSKDDNAHVGPAGGPARGAPPACPSGGSGGVPPRFLFLEEALQLEEGAGQPPVGQPPGIAPPGVGLPGGPELRPRGKGMQRYSPHAQSARPVHLHSPNQAVATGKGKPGTPGGPRSPMFSPFMGGMMARSPLLCPRSPYATYFDD